MIQDLSVIYEAKVSIFELLEEELPNNPATEKVPVIWGQSDANEVVMIWTAESDTEYATVGGPTPKLNEDFRIHLMVEALVASGRDPRPAESRMWEIAQVVGEILREGGIVGGPRALFSRPASVKQEYFQIDKRQGSRARITLAGKARI